MKANQRGVGAKPMPPIHVNTDVGGVMCAGIHESRSSAFCLLAATVCMLLLLSKVAMNLKSLIKDDHWMRRIRLLVERVAQSKGVPTDDSIYDPIYQDASMSNFGFGRGIPAHLAPEPALPRRPSTAARTPRREPAFPQISEASSMEEGARDGVSDELVVEMVAATASEGPSAPLASPRRHVFSGAP